MISPRHSWRLAMRVLERTQSHQVSMMAAGMAFYAILSIFPALGALLSIYGLVADPTEVGRQIAQLQSAVPPAVMEIVRGQIKQVSQGSNAALTFGLVLSIALGLYSASKSTRALVTALNVAYDTRDTRNIIVLYLQTFLMTFGGVVLVICLLSLIGLSGYLSFANIPPWITWLVALTRWLIVLALMTIALGVVYAMAPYRRPPRWQWITPGAVLATMLWLVISVGFSYYIGHFDNYNKMYGSAAAIMIVMIWFSLGAWAILLGAELNAEIEKSAVKRVGAGSDSPLDAIASEPDATGQRAATS